MQVVRSDERNENTRSKSLHNDYMGHPRRLLEGRFWKHPLMASARVLYHQIRKVRTDQYSGHLRGPCKAAHGSY